MSQASPWRKYRRKGESEMRPYIPGEDLTGVSIAAADLEAGSPRSGDMIARNPRNHADQWLVAEKYFQENLEPLPTPEAEQPDCNDAEELWPVRRTVATGLRKAADVVREFVEYEQQTQRRMEELLASWQASRRQLSQQLNNLHSNLQE